MYDILLKNHDFTISSLQYKKSYIIFPLPNLKKPLHTKLFAY